MDKNEISAEIFEKIFLDHSLKLEVFLRGAKTKSDNYDKFRNVGFEKEKRNPIFVSCITRSITPNSLIIRELGLSESGAMQIIIQDQDVSALKLSERIVHNGLEYTPWNKALGNRFQEFPTDFSGYTKIILFRMNK